MPDGQLTCRMPVEMAKAILTNNALLEPVEVASVTCKTRNDGPLRFDS